MSRTAIQIRFVACTSTRPDRLIARTLSARPVSVSVGYWSDKADNENDRYTAALQALLTKLGDGWGEVSQWHYGNTDEGRVYVRPGEGTNGS
jgi:hypothetical protein